MKKKQSRDHSNRKKFDTCGVFVLCSLIALGLLLPLACSSSPPGENDPERVPAEAESAASPERPAGDSDGLDLPAFSSLPPEVRVYLGELSRAFRDGDAAFLLDQGEPLFEAQVRPAYDDDEYFTLMYRAGPYAAEDAPLGPPANPVGIRDIGSVRYSAWEDEGLIIEVLGRLRLKNGSSLPCRIRLVWDLPEPKILGYFP